MIVLRNNRHIHFVGIGGIGMSALAEVLHRLGFTVSGSDREESDLTHRLSVLGMRIQLGHATGPASCADVIVYSSAIRPDNPELLTARERGVPCVKRAEVLGELMRTRFSIGVSGTHGKTTTTSMLGSVLQTSGWDPVVIVGGIPHGLESNALVGGGEVLVAEADEYDRSFLKMSPAVAVITNIEAEHLDCYAGIGEIEDAFVQFAGTVPFFGAVVACVDDPGVNAIMHRLNRVVITYGTEPGADYRARNIATGPTSSRFDVFRGKELLGYAVLGIPGRHNVVNAMAVVAVASELGIEFGTVAGGLEGFRGVKRRFEVVGTAHGITAIDDYAHHPSEIRATLATARVASFQRVVAVFQPHLYTRTRDFLDDFAVALLNSDMLIVTDIYRSREDPIPNVTAEAIVQAAIGKGHANARFIGDLDEVLGVLATEVREGDGVVFLGAGSIGSLARRLVKRIIREED